MEEEIWLIKSSSSSKGCIDEKEILDQIFISSAIC
jgi:hypothetical protein